MQSHPSTDRGTPVPDPGRRPSTRAHRNPATEKVTELTS